MSEKEDELKSRPNVSVLMTKHNPIGQNLSRPDEHLGNTPCQLLDGIPEEQNACIVNGGFELKFRTSNEGFGGKSCPLNEGFEQKNHTEYVVETFPPPNEVLKCKCISSNGSIEQNPHVNKSNPADDVSKCKCLPSNEALEQMPQTEKSHSHEDVIKCKCHPPSLSLEQNTLRPQSDEGSGEASYLPDGNLDRKSQPADGGFGWIIVLAAFLNAMLHAGHLIMYGILLPEYVEYFQVTKASASVVSAVGLSASGLMGEWNRKIDKTDYIFVLETQVSMLPELIVLLENNKML